MPLRRAHSATFGLPAVGTWLKPPLITLDLQRAIGDGAAFRAVSQPAMLQQLLAVAEIVDDQRGRNIGAARHLPSGFMTGSI